MTVVLSYRPRSDFEGLTIEELSDKFSEAKAKLEELVKEFDEIEDLDEADYDEYDFESEEEYEKRLRELDVDIFVLESEVELIENLIEDHACCK